MEERWWAKLENELSAEYTTILDTKLEGRLVVHTSYPNDNVILRNSIFTTPWLMGEKKDEFILVCHVRNH